MRSKINKPQKAGKLFEQQIEDMNKIYAKQGRCLIQKIATPMTNIGNGKYIYAKKSTVDFVGCLNGGRMIAFDAKSCNLKSLPFSNIKEHQVSYLYRVGKLGGLGFLLVYMRRLSSVYIVHVDDEFVQLYTNRDFGGVKSISVDMLSKCVSMRYDDFIMLDYLTIISVDDVK